MTDRDTIHAILCGLVARLGQTSAAYAIQAFTGADKPDHAALSRKVNGTRSWAIDDLLALQAAAESSAVTDYLCDSKPSRPAPGSLYEAMAEASREGGEGMAAVARYADSLSPVHRSNAIKEIREHRESLDGLLDHLETVAVVQMRGGVS